MMKSKVEAAVNEQIQVEFQAAYQYLAMSARFEELNLRGAAQWMRMQWREETIHATKFFDFLIRRGGNPRLKPITEPKISFKTATEAFEDTLAHEQKVTRLIHGLYDLAVSERDYPLQTLLHWFIDEQVEEEEAAEEIIQSLKLAGDTGEGLFMVDRELGQRSTIDKD
ncbi:MAG: ferritin [Bacteroidetes bacterium]|nr:ferritin [Bacteroidota bacterium]MCH8247277.1 ferritin [Bacteroidota bacterium]